MKRYYGQEAEKKFIADLVKLGLTPLEAEIQLLCVNNPFGAARYVRETHGIDIGDVRTYCAKIDKEHPGVKECRETFDES